MRQPRCKAASTAVAGARVLIIGGAADIEGTKPYRTTEISDARHKQWPPAATRAIPVTRSVGPLSDSATARSSSRAAPPCPNCSARTRWRPAPSAGHSWPRRQFLTATPGRSPPSAPDRRLRLAHRTDGTDLALPIDRAPRVSAREVRHICARHPPVADEEPQAVDARRTAEGTWREHQRGHARPLAVTLLLPIPPVCRFFVAGVTRACPRFPPRS